MIEVVSQIFLFIRIVIGLSCLVMVIAIIWLATKTEFYKKKIYTPFISYQKEPSGVVTPEKYSIKPQWDDIVARMKTQDEANMKLAVIEADKLLDTVLKKLHIPGETMGERLKSVPDGTFTNFDAIWQAHRLRNHLVHTSEFELTPKKTEKALAIFEQAFKDIHVL